MSQKGNVLSKFVQEGSQKIKQYSHGIYEIIGNTKRPTGSPQTREKILRSTLDLISQRYTTNISIRDIAEHADVNIASINYHFHSKDKMLIELFSQAIKGFDRLFILLEPSSLNTEQTLIRWADRLMRYLLLYPGVLTIVRDSHKWQEITELVEAALLRLQERLDPLLLKLSEESGHLTRMDDTELGFRRSMLLGSLLQPLFPLTPAFDLRSRLRLENFRKTYVIQVVQQQKNQFSNIKFNQYYF